MFGGLEATRLTLLEMSEVSGMNLEEFGGEWPLIATD
jgi:hypothetical protein